MIFLHRTRFNPHRAPDVRYQRARELLQANNRPYRFHDDEATKRIFAFMRDRQKVKTSWDECQLYVKEKALFTAFQLYETSRPQTRWLLEARLLAGETWESIATKLGVKEDAIEWYARTFFDVANRLDARDFIMNEVIGAPQGSDQASLEEHHWKTLGYLGGPAALDELLTGAFPFVERSHLGKGSAELWSYGPRILRQ